MTGWPSALGVLFRGMTSKIFRATPPRPCSSRTAWIARAADRVYRLARGHPLSLRLAASALAERPDISLEAVTVKAIIEGLTEIYLGILDPRTREITTRPRSSAGQRSRCSPRCFPGPQDAFDRLRRLPFVELSDDGLVIHDTVREAIAAAAAVIQTQPLEAVPSGGLAPAAQ